LFVALPRHHGSGRRPRLPRRQAQPTPRDAAGRGADVQATPARQKTHQIIFRRRDRHSAYAVCEAISRHAVAHYRRECLMPFMPFFFSCSRAMPLQVISTPYTADRRHPPQCILTALVLRCAQRQRGAYVGGPSAAASARVPRDAFSQRSALSLRFVASGVRSVCRRRA